MLFTPLLPLWPTADPTDETDSLQMHHFVPYWVACKYFGDGERITYPMIGYVAGNVGFP